jgi:DNA-binding FadR family transcriptional regulator
MVGENLKERKSGCRIASQIEEDLIRRRWPVGLIYGSELELADRFQVGRSVIREAVRILEVRGSARMRRGPKGGLQVLRPGREQTVDMIVGYVMLRGLTLPQLTEARSLIEDVRRQMRGQIADSNPDAIEEFGRIETVALSFFDTLLQTVERLVAPGEDRSLRPGRNAVPLFHRSRAGQIAQRLMLECSHEDWIRGCRLGSAFDLCERYSVDRGVLRQAIRILESADTAVSTCGRGHGVISRPPRPASVCRLINCHFAAHGLSAGAGMELFHWFSVHVMERVARRVTAAEVAHIYEALEKLARAPEAGRAEALFEVEESQFSLLRNPLVDILLRSTKSYPVWNIAEGRTTQLLDQVYLVETRKVAAALAKNSPAEAALAQDLKFRRLADISGHPRLHQAASWPRLAESHQSHYC